MNTYLKKHQTSYGFDKTIIYINDKIEEYIKSLLSNLKFEHIFDDKKITCKEIIKNNNKGYCNLKKNFENEYYLYFIEETLQKKKETLLEILSYFKREFEKIGIYLEEYISSNEEQVCLKTYKGKIITSFIGKITSQYVEIKITKLLDLITYDLPFIFYPFEFCFFTQNNNRSEIIKKRTELLNLKGEEINSSEQFKCHFFPFLVITSVSLINSNKFRVCLDNNLDKAIVINSSDLGQYLVKFKLKYTRKKYIKNMEDSLHKFSNKIVLCKNCISKMNNRIIYKSLVQDDLSLMCQVCNKQVGLKYLQK